MRTHFAWRLFVVVVFIAVANFVVLTPVQSQVRGVYPVGMSAANSGVTPEPGITYSNLFVFFSRDEEKGSHGEILATGQNSIMMDMNSFVWVSKREMARLGGAVFSASATLPIANNSLTSDVNQPVILGWNKRRLAIRTIYGFLAPTGRFNARANTNVGSGYWTSVVASGQTIYLSRSKATALSAFQMYEFHGTQQGTMVHPGQTFNLDYSLIQSFPIRPSLRLQLGVVGYGQWQTTDKHGPSIAPEQSAVHYKVNALGFAANAVLPEQKVSVGVKYFHEFECRSTFQGYTLQISAAIGF
jgi:hypothetical protein